MKTILSLTGVTLFLTVLLSSPVQAQEKTREVKVSISIDGEKIKDTTYMVKDESAARLAADVIDMTLGDTSMKKSSKVYAVVKGDGKTYEWKSDDPGSGEKIHYFFSDEDPEEDEMTIEIIREGDKMIEKKVIIEKQDGKNEKTVHQEVKIKKITDPALKDGDIEWIEEDGRKILIIDDGDVKKRVIRIEDENEGGTDYEFRDENGETIIINKVGTDDDEEIKVEVIVEDEENSTVEKEKKKQRKKIRRKKKE